MMRTVLQGDEYGCAAACVAMLANLPYRRACSVVFGEKEPDYVRKSLVISALEKLDFRTIGEGRLGQVVLSDLQHNALIKGFLLESDSWNGHFMVWDASQRVLRDPYGYRRPLRCTSYTMVVR